MVQTTAPMGNVSPSFAIVFNIPAFSAVNSNVALSDSSSAIASSIATASPSFFIQRDKVTSVIDSPTVGTFTSREEVVAGAGCDVGAVVGAASLLLLLLLTAADSTGAASLLLLSTA